MKITKWIMASMLFFAIAGFTISEEWFQYTSTQGGYKIEFPQKPVENQKQLAEGAGNLKLNMAVYDASKSNDDNLIYMANYTEYPDSMINAYNKEEQLIGFFRNAVDGCVKNVHGKLLSETVIDLKGFPGREVKIDFKDGLAVIKMRLFLAKNKMYMLEIITKTKNDFNKSIDRFMDSFSLIN